MGIEFENGWHTVTTIFVMILVCAFVWLSYRRNLDVLSRRKAALLLALRLGAVLFLLFCVLKPVISYRSVSGEKSRLILLVDDSRSMILPVEAGDTPEPRIDIAKKLAGGSNGLETALGGYFSVQTYRFSGGASQIPAGKLESTLDGSGSVTAVTASLREAASKSGATAPAAAVVITDGADNSASDSSGRTLGFPVFTIGVGSRLSETGLVDVLVGTPQAPEEAFKNTTVEVEVEVRASGLKNPTSVPLTILGPENELLAAGEVELSAEKTKEQTVLSFVPDSPGIFEYTVSVPERQDEHIKENNRQSFTLHVLDSKLRVLLVDRARWEYKYLKMALEQDPNVQFTGAVLTQKNLFTLQGTGRGELVTRGLPTDVSGYENWDVVILGELDGEAFTLKQLDALKDFVSTGGGFCALGGRSALGQGGYGGSPLEEILPVELGGRSGGMRSKNFVMRLTREGKSHSVMRGIVRFFEADSENACELEGINVTGKLKPGATVIAAHPELSTDGGEAAVIAVQRYGEGKTMVVTGSTTYKWHLKHRGMGLESPHVKFWGQSVRWLADVKGPDSGGLFEIWTDRRNYLPGQSVQITARISTGQLMGSIPEEIAVDIIRENSEQKKHLLPAGVSRTYEGEFLPDEGGKYEISASLMDSEGKAVTKTTRIMVGSRYLEFENPDLNEEYLRRIAAESGGRYYAYHESARLIRDIETVASAHSEEKEISIWDTPLFFLVFLGFATVEWLMRKRNMLI